MATIDPRRIADQKDAWVTALYAKTKGQTDDDGVLPLVIDASGYLLVNMTVGTLTLTSTASTITNAAGNPVNVALTSTKVTVDNTVTVALSSTKVTIDNTPTVSLSSTIVTLATTGVTVSIGRTLTGSTGSLTATNGSISITPSTRIKVYAFSLTTTSATELTCVFNSGGVANGLELWRATLMAPAGANSGANLAVTPPAFLFASRSGTAVSLSLSSAALVHYSISYFEEA